MRLLIVLFFPLFCLAQDAENCKDSPLVSRFPGSEIRSCEHKEFDSYKMPVGKDSSVETPFEGEYWSWDMATREGTSALQVYRNFQTALQRAGWTLDFQSSPDRFTAHKEPYHLDLQSDGVHYYVFLVKVQPMKQEVTADAAAMASEIDKSGHVAVYGINFDTGKAAILPESADVLAQVLKLLTDRPTLKVRVEGHTDNVGSRAANQVLSQKRAAAVVGWLISQGIDSSQLSAQGFADTKPVADNGTEEGRAKNRRVELVKQ